MSKKPVNLSGLTIAALEKAVQQSERCRLIAAPSKPGLLAGGKATAAKTQAEAECLDPELALFTIETESEKKGKTTSTVTFVTITKSGVQHLFEPLSIEKQVELLKQCIDTHRPAAIMAVMQALNREQDRLDREREELLKILTEMTNAQVSAQRKLTEQREAIQAFHLQEDSGPRPPVSPVPIEKAIKGRPRPVQDGEQDFERNTCRELVFAWQDTSHPDAKAALEAVMINTGALYHSDEHDAIVEFDGNRHSTHDNLMPGDAARVVQPGWEYESAKGKLLMAKSAVEAIPSSKRLA